MQAPKPAAGARGSLKDMVSAAGAARVLDLHALAIETPPDDPDYVERPLFAHPVLNRAVIMKYNVPQGQEDKLAPRRFNATKIVFPFDSLDLDLGGQILFIDQHDFPATLARVLDYTGLPLERDVGVLRILDRLPTLDPFLIRETLNQQRIEVARCYLRLSNIDQAHMMAFVGGEMEALVRLCFGDLEANGQRSTRLSQLLLAEQESAELQPLRDIFRMDTVEFSEAMFSWKAFLYYRWRSQALAPALGSTLEALRSVRADRYSRTEAAFVEAAKTQLKRAGNTAWRDISQRLKLYDQAFGSLTDGRNLESFRAFLVRGPTLYLELGAAIGQVEQMVGFWAYCFGFERLAALSPDLVLDGLRDLMQALSIAGKAAGPGPRPAPRALSAEASA